MAFKFDFALDTVQQDATLPHGDTQASDTTLCESDARCIELPSPQPTGIPCGQIEHIDVLSDVQLAKV